MTRKKNQRWPLMDMLHRFGGLFFRFPCFPTNEKFSPVFFNHIQMIFIQYLIII